MKVRTTILYVLYFSVLYSVTSPWSHIDNREQERKVGPDGFLDSSKLSHTFHVKKEREKTKGKEGQSRPTVVRLSTRIENDKKDHDKKIKVIEVWSLSA